MNGYNSPRSRNTSDDYSFSPNMKGYSNKRSEGSMELNEQLKQSINSSRNI